ncbi:universal stress protein A [Streptomyces capitiformicae]|uniref:Universal stress protein A n=1 Tax=Streptomyces capitiformicae TaxID=2014920 RepID=A0A918YZA9_9ACTN|nr:universal stress protein A [Streptomyces capitiformicae]
MTDRRAHQFERGTDGPKVILVGLDGSDSSLRAVAYAAGLARRQQSLLATVYVQPTPAASAALGAPVAGTTDAITEQLVAEIREAAEQVKGIFEVRWAFHTFRGDPYSGLVKAADELQADAVVVGVSEQAGHRFVDSVKVRLVKAGRRPVTVVPWYGARPCLRAESPKHRQTVRRTVRRQV